jgi:SAM-dependent methyltransferase
MSARFQELDWQQTPMGEISLRRRRDPASGAEVHEVKLGEEFLMSDLFTAGEVALARLGLAALPEAGLPDTAQPPEPAAVLDVVVGGLGLGYTAATALEDPRVRSVTVVEALGEVISWHERGMVPLGGTLTSDPRCRLLRGDFFALAAPGGEGFDPGAPARLFDAVLLDIDHAPDQVLHPSHTAFYTPDGLRALARRLRPGGVFALWSNDPPSEEFRAVLAEVFPVTAAHVVSFDNPLQGRPATNTVYLGHTADG